MMCNTLAIINNRIPILVIVIVSSAASSASCCRGIEQLSILE